MRKVFFNKEQIEMIKESIENNKKVDSISFLLSNSPLKNISETSIKNTLMKGYEEAVSCFSDDITSFDENTVVTKLNKLIRICQKKEEPIREQLEKLCTDLVTSIFNLDDKEMELTVNLINEISKTQQFHISASADGEYEYDSIESRDSLNLEEEKRKYINTLILGASLSLTETLLKKSLSEIFELDEELPHLYNKIVKINNYLLFITKEKPSDENNLQGAFEKVTLSRNSNEVKINVSGIIFPFLLTETIRAFIEIITAKTLPENSHEANLIISNCDTLEDEPFYMTFGQTVWKNNVSELDPENYQELFNGLTEIDTQEFNSLMREVLEGTKLGKQEFGNIVSQVKQSADYQSFEKDLQKKREENNLIVDEYIGEEELLEDAIDEANYPETFNMEEFKQLSSFNARVKYCRARLKYLGKGSARIVFQIDEGTVLKLAYNQKGIGQNEADARVKNDWYLRKFNFLPEVYDVDENYLWIEMQIARRAKASDFKRLTGYDFKTLCYWVTYCWNYSVAYSNETIFIPDEYRMLFRSDKWIDVLEYSIFSELEDYIGNYGVQGIGDLQKINSWGVVIDKDGNENLVLVDNGLDNDVLEKYYKL